MTADFRRSFGNDRQHRRLDVTRQLILISVTSRIEGVMQDLSRSGARVSLREAPPRRGRDVLLRYGPHEIFGQVVWCSGTEAGIEFHTPISAEELAETVGYDVPEGRPAGRMVL